MKPEFIEARDLPDAWFQSVYRLLETGREYTIDRGSFQGQKRLEYDYVTVHIKYPGVRPLIPDIPPSLGIPNPVDEGYLEEYLPYLMTSAKKPGEDYTYGQYLEKQIEEVVMTLHASGESTRGSGTVDSILWFISGPGTCGTDFLQTWGPFSC
jgi:thymidylate synthase